MAVFAVFALGLLFVQGDSMAAVESGDVTDGMNSVGGWSYDDGSNVLTITAAAISDATAVVLEAFTHAGDVTDAYLIGFHNDLSSSLPAETYASLNGNIIYRGNIPATGTPTGDWTYSVDTRELKISSSTASAVLPDCEPGGDTPWTGYFFKGCAETVRILDGTNSYTSGGRYLLDGFTSVTTVYSNSLTRFDPTMCPDTVSTVEMTKANSFVTGFTLSGRTALTVASFPALKSIPSYAFSGCTALTSYTFGVASTAVGSHAFSGCTSLAVLNGQSNLSTLGAGAFRGTALTSISMTGLTSMGTTAAGGIGTFEDCTSLAEAEFGSLTMIGIGAFRNCVNLVTIDYGSNLKEINDEAFKGCVRLEWCDLPATMVVIKPYAFYGCEGFESITLPITVGNLEIRNFAFSKCGATNVLTIPASVTTIGSNAFREAKITGLTFAEGSVLKTIGEQAFFNCADLGDTVSFATSIETIDSYAFNGCSSLESISLPEGAALKVVGKYAFRNTHLSGDLNLGDNITSIGEHAFSETRISSLTVGFAASGTIVVSAFEATTSLASITLTGGLTDIDRKAFYGCTALTEVSLPSSLATIGNQAFFNCTVLTEVSLPSSLATIGNQAFYGCTALTEVSLPSSLATIGSEAFRNAGISSISFPDSLAELGSEAFRNCRNLTGEMNLEGVVTVGDGVFRYTSITGISFGPDVESIGKGIYVAYEASVTLAGIEVDPGNTHYRTIDGALYTYDGTTLLLCPMVRDDAPVLPKSLVTIDEYAMYHGRFSGNLVIPANVTKIGSYAINDCKNLTGLEIRSPFPGLFSDVVNPAAGLTGVKNLVVPMSLKYESLNSSSPAGPANALNSISPETIHFTGMRSNLPSGYFEAAGSTKMPWYNKTVKAIYFDEGVQEIDSHMFYNCKVESVEMSDTVTSIGEQAFAKPSADATLKRIVLSSALIYVGEDCFKNNTALEVLTAPIGLNLAWGVSSSKLTNLNLIGGASEFSVNGYAYSVNPSDSNYYGRTPWYNSAGKYTVTIDDSIVSIGDNMFLKPKSNVAFGSSLTVIGENAFNGAELMSEVDLSRVTRIGNGAFADCVSLQRVAISDSFAPVEVTHPFTGCTLLSRVTIPINIDYSTYNLFYGCSVAEFVFTGGPDGTGHSYDAADIPDTPWYKSISGKRSITISFADSVRSIGDNMFNGAAIDIAGVRYGIGGAVSFPHVVSIGEDAFHGCSTISSLGFGPDLEVISEGAFSGCSSTHLKSITIPDSVVSLGAGAFSGCTSVEALTIPISLNAVASASKPVFWGCTGIEAVSFTGGTAGVAYTDTETDSDYRLTPWHLSRAVFDTLSFGPNVTGIGDYTFKGCTNLSDPVILPDSIVSIGAHAFDGCTGLTSFTGGKVTGMGVGAFSGCTGLATVSFDKLATVPYDAFKGCASLTTASLDACTRIYAAAFMDSGIMDVNGDDPASNPVLNLPKVTAIGGDAFKGCGSIASAILTACTTIGDSAFESSSILGINDDDSILLEKAVSIGARAFAGTAVTDVVIGKAGVSLTIGESALAGCAQLENVAVNGDVASLPASLIKGGSDSFASNLVSFSAPHATVFRTDLSGAAHLETLDISGATEITGGSLFAGCTSLHTVALYSSESKIVMPTLPRSAFEGCTSLSTINLDTVNLSSGREFYGCTSLSDVEVGCSPFIPAESFRGCTGMTSFSAPRATAIGERALASTGLTSIEASDLPSVATIHDFAFSGCASLTSFGASGSLRTIGASAFSGCSNLSKGYDGETVSDEIRLESVEAVGASAFSGTRVTGFVFGAALREIGADALKTPVLVSVEIDEGNPVLSSVGGIVYDKAVTELVFCPSKVADAENIALPGTLRHIRAGAFEDVELTGVLSLPSSIYTVGSRAFANCLGLTSLVVNSSGIYAMDNSFASDSFEGCTNITALTVPTTMMLDGLFSFDNGITSIDFTGANSNLPSDYYLNNHSDMPWVHSTGSVSIRFTGTTTIIDSYMFCFDSPDSAIVSIDLCPSVQTIGDYAFKNCEGLERLALPDKLGSVGTGMLHGCSGIRVLSVPITLNCAFDDGGIGITGLTDLTFTAGSNGVGFGYTEEQSDSTLWHGSSGYRVSFAEGVKSIGDNMLLKPMATSVLAMPSSMRAIGENAFSGSDISEVVLNRGLETIGSGAFSDCTRLASIEIPDTVVTLSMANGAPFGGCYNLTEAILPITINYAKTNPFTGCDKLARFVFTEGSTTAQSGGREATLAGVGAVYSAPDSGAEDSVANTPWYAVLAHRDFSVSFHRGVSMTSSIVSIGAHMFDGCAASPSTGVVWGLSGSIQMPSSIRSIGDDAFRGCAKLSGVLLNDGIQSIGEYAFSGCSEMTDLSIPDGAVVGKAAFSDCVKIATLTLPISLNAVVDDDEPLFGGSSAIAGVVFTGGSPAFDYADSSGHGRFYQNTPWHLCRGNSISFSFDSSVDGIGDNMFRDCTAIDSSLVLPATITAVGDNAFDGCTAMTSFTANGVESIGESAFRGCTAMATFAADAAASAGAGALEGCTGMTSASLPALAAVSDGMFRGCSSLTDAVLTGCTSIGAHAFEDSAIRNINHSGEGYLVDLPNVVSVGDRAFAGSGVVDAVIGSTGVATSFGNGVFLDCADLVTVNINGDVSVLPADTFRNAESTGFASKLRTLNAKGVKRFAADVSGFAALIRVDLSTATAFGTDGAPTSGHFKNCTSLAEVRMLADPAKPAVALAPSMFEGCTSLSDIDLENADLGADRIFFGCTSLTALDAPMATSVGASAFAGSGLTGISADSLPSVTSIKASAFESCASLASFEASASLESIGDSAFSGCASLASITGSEMPSVRTIGVSAFEGSPLSGAVSLPSIVSMGDRAFHGTSVSSFSFGAALESIGELALFDMMLESVSVDEGNTRYAVDASGLLYRTGSDGDRIVMETLVLLPARAPLSDVSVSPEAKYILHHAAFGATFDGMLTIPASVLSVGERAFGGCAAMTGIEIQAVGADLLDPTAFEGCTSVSKLTVPITVKLGDRFSFANSISEYVFTGGLSSLLGDYYRDNRGSMPWSFGPSASVAFADGVGEVDAWMFCFDEPSHAISSVTLGSTVSKIGARAFYNCAGLASLVIPDSVSSIGESCLYGCGGIRSLTVPISTDMAIDANREIGIAGLESLRFTMGTGAGFSYTPETSGYTPWHGNSGYTVTFDAGIVSIGDNMHLKPGVNFSLPASLEVIGEHAFSGSAITSVDLKNVREIRESAFEGCIGLRDVTIPDSVTAMTGSPFRDCVAISSAAMPITLDYASCNPFIGCMITSFTFTGGQASAMGEGFDYTEASVRSTPWLLTCLSDNDISVAFSGSVKSIGDHMFDGCAKQAGELYKGLSGEVSLPDSVAVIGDGAFRGCNRISSLVFGSGLESIGTDAFNGCSGLTSLELPQGLEAIGPGSFRGCSGLTSLVIPVTVNSVADGMSPAFRGCERISSITFTGAGEGVDYTLSDGDSYYACTPWHYSRSENISMEFRETVTGIGDYTFFECTALSGSLVLPGSIRTVGQSAFEGCSRMESLTIGNTSAALESRAFHGCSGLTSLTIPIGINAAGAAGSPIFGGCTSITDLAFTGTSGYQYSAADGDGSYRHTPWHYSRTRTISVSFADTVKSIGDNMFRDCTGLSGSVVCNDVMDSIGADAFRGCIGIRGITAPGVANMGAHAFDGCSSLESAELAKLQGVPDYAFAGCSYLSSAVLTACTSIGAHAFEYSGIRQVNSASSVNMSKTTVIGERAFAGSGIVDATFGDPRTTLVIGGGAFYECTGIRTLSILGRVGSLPADTFKDDSTDVRLTFAMTSLTAPSVGTFLADMSSNFTSLASVDISGTTSFGAGILRTGLFKDCAKLAEVRLFADPLNATQVRLPPSMFEGCRMLSGIDLQNVRLEYGREFFGCTSLESVDMPLSVTITPEAFRGCTSLTSFSAESATKVDSYAFAESGVENVLETDLPNVTIVGDGAYSGCVSLVGVSLPKVENAGENVFSGCTQLASASMDSLGVIGKGMFHGCVFLLNVSARKATKVELLAFYDCRALGSIELEKVTDVGSTRSGSSFDDHATASVFYNCISLRTVSMPAVKVIGSLAFYRCGALTSFNDAGGVAITTATEIGFGAFAESGVSSVTVGREGGSLTSIGEQAFYACSYLTSFSSPSLRTLPAQLFSTTDENSPSLVPLLGVVDVPAAESFEANLHGSTSLATVRAPAARYFAPAAFMGCTQLTTVQLMESPSAGNAVKLSPRLFHGCVKLASINLTNVQLDGSADDPSNGRTFYNCSSLVDISMPVATSIPAGAFHGCTKIENVDAPAATIVGAEAFHECIALGSASIGNATIIGDRAFMNCSALSDLNPGTGLNPFIRITSIGSQAFMNCAFSELVLGPMLTELDEGAFQGCRRLASVVVPNTLTNISERTFQGCPLESIHVSSGVIGIAARAFDFTGVASVSTIEVWFNGTLQNTTLAPMSFVFPADSSVKVHVNRASAVAAVTLQERGCFYGAGNLSFSEEINGTVRIQFEDGSQPAYNTLGAIYGGKVVLPYYSSGSVVKDYVYCTTSNGFRLAVFEDDEAFALGVEGIAKSGSGVPVYPLMNDDSVTFSGAADAARFTSSYELVTEDYEEPAHPGVQSVHYGGIIEIPEFNNPLAKLMGITLYRNNGIVYNLPVETESIRTSYYFTSIAVMSGDTMVNVMFQSKGEKQTVEVLLLSSFALPEGLAGMESPLTGYVFAGWWSNPDQGGEMATFDTKFLAGQVWYARFTPMTFTVTVECDKPFHLESFEMTGPYTLHVSDGNLYYTDALHDAATMIFKRGSIPGYDIRLYMDREASKQVVGDYGPITDNRTIDLSMQMLAYEVGLRFVLDDEEVSPDKVFTIPGWGIGSGSEYRTGDRISNIPFEYSVGEDGTVRTILDGIAMPVPLNNEYAMSSMYAGDDEIVFYNGYTLNLADFDGGTSVQITYVLTQGLYKVSFSIDDDTGRVAGTGDNYREGDVITMATVRGLSKTGYTFAGFSIDGMDQVWDAMERVELTAEMIDRAENCLITIHGVWDKIRYTVNFDLAEHDGSRDPMTGVEIGTTIELPQISGYVGHQVTGWHWVLGESQSETYKGELILDKAMIDSFASSDRRMVLEAEWGAKTYRLTVDTSSGIKFIDDEATFGEQFRLWDIGSYTRKYMVFNGWQVGAEGARVYPNNSSVALNAEMAAYGDEHDDVIMFYMSWKDNEYMVQYNLDGGDGTTPIDDKVYTVGRTQFVMPDDIADDGSELFYKNGYFFIGWRYSFGSPIVYNNTSGLFDSVLAQNADERGIVTFYAVWSQKSYKIAYSLDGGRTGSFAPTNALYGDEVTISTPVKAGYEFTGWKATGTTSGALCSSSAGFRTWDGQRIVLTSKFMDLCDDQDGVVTMFATWTAATYVVSWDLNGASQGNLIGGAQSIVLGDEIRVPELRNAVKTGYYPAGWSVDKVNPISEGAMFRSDMVSADGGNAVVFYVVWKPIEYTIEYRYTETDGVETYRTSFENNVNIPMKSRPGREFIGWTVTNADLNNAYYSMDGSTWYKMGSGAVNASYFKNLSTSSGATVSMVGNWVDLQYSIAYDSNGGTGKVPIDSKKYTVGSRVSLADYNVLTGTNGNKSIIGWSLGTDGAVVNITEFTEGLVAKADVTRTIVLYGSWIEGMITVTVDLQDAKVSSIPAGWLDLGDNRYSKSVSYGTSTKDVMSDWEDVTVMMDGYTFERWDFGSGSVMSNITVKPVMEKVNNIILYIFFGSIGAALVAIPVFARLKR